MGSAAFSFSTYTPDDLIADGEQPLVRLVTIPTGNIIAKGAVLGRITASQKHIASLSAAGDGSQTPDAILLVAVNNQTGGDVQAPALFAGRVIERALVFGAAHTAASTREGLRAKGIHFVGSEAR